MEKKNSQGKVYLTLKKKIFTIYINVYNRTNFIFLK